MLYFELLQRAVGKYSQNFDACHYSLDLYLPDNEIPSGMVSYCATRIWREQNGKVDYVKFNGGNPVEQEVDMKEFIWIKLTAQEI